MSTPVRRRLAMSLVTLVATGLGSVLPVSTGSTTETGSTPRARAVLAQAQGLFAPTAHRAYTPRAVASSDTRGATLVLRDLRLALPELDRADARAAERLLSRPDDDSDPGAGGFHYNAPSKVDCAADLCVHWVESTRDAVSLADADADGVPDAVETMQRVLETAYRHSVSSGYRAPLGDEGLPGQHGPDGRVDVYLADVASLGFYGYCPTDRLADDARTASGYCVLDNDYASEQVGTEPVVALRAAVAHELFHLVQYAYDAREDPWFMEGTSTWMEDEVFDSANDNWNYLPTSTLAHPRVPADFGDDYYPYGAWTWWRFLSEYLGSARRADPQVVHDIWEAAGDPARDRDSLTATRFVLARRGTTFRRAFADYSALSHVSRRWYAEGDDAPYPQAPMARHLRLGRRHRGTGPMRSLHLDHLTSANVSLSRTATLRSSRRLRLWIDGPTRVSQPAVEVTLHRRDGSLAWRTVRLDRKGDGVLTVPFAHGRVARVVVTLVNASPRMRCQQSTTLACAGLPLDDGRAYSWRARIVR